VKQPLLYRLGFVCGFFFLMTLTVCLVAGLLVWLFAVASVTTLVALIVLVEFGQLAIGILAQLTNFRRQSP
jgi:hypothetical protein